MSYVLGALELCWLETLREGVPFQELHVWGEAFVVEYSSTEVAPYRFAHVYSRIPTCCCDCLSDSANQDAHILLLVRAQLATPMSVKGPEIGVGNSRLRVKGCGKEQISEARRCLYRCQVQVNGHITGLC